jgi:hypothetical protein
MIGAMLAPRLVFVLSPYQNAFFHEIAEVLVHELSAAGASTALTSEPGEHEVQDHDVFVLTPQHEYVALEGTAFVDDPVTAARTIGISAEQPHQPFFAQNAALGARLGAVLDFSPLAVQAYRDRGVPADHLAFGYTPLWDRFRSGVAPEGPPRVLYMGNKRPRRLAALAEAAPTLARERARLIISDNSSPNRASGPAFLAGDDKRALLASTRLLVNIHQSDERYFEWLRFAEAAHCGAPFLTEASINTDPYLDGVHFESFEPAELAQRIESLVHDDARLGELREAAYQRLRERPLSSSVGVLVDTAVRLLASPPPRHLPPRSRIEPLSATREEVCVSRPATAMRRQPARFTRDTSLEQIDVARTSEWRLRRLGAQVVVFAPTGTEYFDDGIARMTAALDAEHVLVSAIVCGCDASGEPTLEGIWPWETWRLRAGQHLGRLLVVRGDVVRAAAGWLADPGFAGAPHAAIAAWVAVHGGRGAHVSTPVARVQGTVLDPSHALSPTVIAHMARLLS